MEGRDQSLKIAVIIVLWILFILLTMYTVLTHRKSKFVKDKESIRRVWYLIFILGSIIFLSVEPTILFTNWQNFLIVLIGFIVIDYFLFLNLYFSKIGGHELNTAEIQVDETQDIVDMRKRKLDNMEETLNNYAFLSYTINRNEYIEEVEKLFNTYAKKEALFIRIFSLHNTEWLHIVPKSIVADVKDSIEHNKSFFNIKQKIAFIPLLILNEYHVVSIRTASTSAEISNMDVQVINILLMVYVLTVGENIDNEGGEQ